MGLTGVVAIAAGGYHSLALKSDDTIVGWGYNGYGEAAPPAGFDGSGGHRGRLRPQSGVDKRRLGRRLGVQWGRRSDATDGVERSDGHLRWSLPQLGIDGSSWPPIDAHGSGRRQQ